MSMTRRFEKIAAHGRVLKCLAKIYYRSVLKREIALANIQESDRVVFIGGGPLPMSALLLEKMSGAKTTVIDCDPRAVEIAERFVAEESSNLTCRCEEGQSLNLDDFSVVFIARQVVPCPAVLAHIFDTARKGTRIVCRFRNRPPATRQIVETGRRTCLFVV